MLNEIIKGVSMKLNATFGNGYRIYQNDVKQGLKEPCFFIAVLKPDLSPLLWRRYLKRHPLDVHFFPAEEGNNSELYKMADQMLEALEFITLSNGDLLHGTSMNYEVVDGVLHFFVNYNMIILKPGEENPMETLDIEVGTQKG